jgi:PAS domain S-box-containing protein
MDTELRIARRKFFLNIVLPSILAVVLFIVTLFFIVLPNFKQSMMDRKREMISELTNTATSILDKYHKDELDGVLSREEAQNTAISRIEYLRYGEDNKDYFWITDMQPVMIVHPYRPELNGQDLSDFEDSHGKLLFVECVKVVKENKHGYVEYMWQWKDDSSHIVPKLSYVNLFEPWGWIVGTGIYIEDVKHEIADLTRSFIIISIIISVIVALILIYIGRQSYKIEIKRNKAEKELNRSREKYRSMVEASTEGLLMFMDGKIFSVNLILEKLTGYSSAELYQQKIEGLFVIPEEIKKCIQQSDYSFKQNSYDSKLRLKSGIESDILLNINPVKFYDQDAVIFSIKDISSDKLVREELLSSKEKFKTLMDKLNQGIFRTSLDKKGRFFEANITALNIFGFKSFSEIEDKYILDFFVEESDKRTFRKVLLRQGFIKNQIMKLRNKSGEHIYANVSLVVIYDGDEPKFCDGIIQDISLQKAAEVQPDTINSDYVSFMQLLFQPINNFALKAVQIKHNSTIDELANCMSEHNSDMAIIYAEPGEFVGYVDDKIIRKRYLNSKEKPKYIYKIMSSPIDFVNPESSVIDALRLISKSNQDHLLLKPDSASECFYVRKGDLLVLNDFIPVNILNSIENARTFSELKNAHNKFVSGLIPIIESGTDSKIIFHNLSFISDVLCQKIIERGISEFGEPPVPFSFITLGSEGRQEQTLNTDQDNAIIYQDVEPDKQDEVKKYFDILAEFVCTKLDEVGYEFCKGGIMAMNPTYCQSISVWKKYFSKWINTGTGKDLLDISVFFDFRVTYGEESFAVDLRNYINELTKKNPAYLMLLAQDNLRLKPQVNFWGNILLETAGAPPETVNIKEAIMPIVNFARIYALNSKLSKVSTLERLYELKKIEVLNDSTYMNIIQSYEHLQLMRLKRQAGLIRNGLKPDNFINTKHLSDLDTTILKKLLSHINTMLSKLSYDFKGTI